MAVEIGFHMPIALWPTAECALGMQIGVVIDVNKRFESHAEAFAVIEEPAVVIGDAPGPCIEIETAVEFAALRKTAELGISVAATQRPTASTNAVLVFQHLHAVTGLAKFECGHEARKPRTQHEDGCAFRIAVELDGAFVIGLDREAQ